MGRSKSSRRWQQEHRNDAYVHKARQAGYRARAAYKLIELDEKDRLLHPGMYVLDLGASPGSWSQYAATRVGTTGSVLASDILAMEPIAGVEFVQGDFREDAVLHSLRQALGGRGVDLVMSDMAPNMSGVDVVDQPASMALTELAHALAVEVLESGGALVTKMFQGEGSDAFVRELRRDFSTVRLRKPRASRDRSREVYLVATGRQL